MRPKLLHRRLRHRLHGLGVGDVADMDQRLAASGLDLARDRFRLGAVAARIDEDGRAAFRQRQRDRAADVAPRAGDDGDLAVEFVVARHSILSIVMPGLVPASTFLLRQGVDGRTPAMTH